MKLVMGGSGFLGSHVVRELVDRGEQVRVMLRESSPTVGIDGLENVERVYGELTDLDAVRRAMEGVDDVFYCVVDTRAWLRDPAPLFRTNVEALRGVLDVALGAELNRFVFTSSVTTLARNDERPVTEADPHNWLEKGGAYVRSRMEAERLVLSYASRGLPAVVMCVSNTYGANDFVPTPHGQLVKAASRGKIRWYIRGAASEVVGIRSAAQALVLAAEKGRVGERYAVTERYLSMREMFDLAAAEGGHPPLRIGIPYPVIYAAGALGELVGRLTRTDQRLTRTSARLMKIYTPVDHSKAGDELGWDPVPTPVELAEQVAFFNRPKGPAA